jgi:mannitol-specific phosphotransferase system IIBC component
MPMGIAFVYLFPGFFAWLFLTGVLASMLEWFGMDQDTSVIWAVLLQIFIVTVVALPLWLAVKKEVAQEEAAEKRAEKRAAKKKAAKKAAKKKVAKKSNHCKECGDRGQITRGYCRPCYGRARLRVRKGGSWTDPDIAKKKVAKKDGRRNELLENLDK